MPRAVAKWHDDPRPNARTEALQLWSDGGLWHYRREHPSDVWPVAVKLGDGHGLATAQAHANRLGLHADDGNAEPDELPEPLEHADPEQAMHALAAELHHGAVRLRWLASRAAGLDSVQVNYATSAMQLLASIAWPESDAPRCPSCGLVMSNREAAEQGECNACHGGAADLGPGGES